MPELFSPTMPRDPAASPVGTVPDGRATADERHLLRALVLVAGLVALVVWLPGAAVFLGILSALVVVHETGHYVVARRAGMAPTEFFVGFGPTVWARTTPHGLRVGIKAIPAGGYVKIPGMGPRELVDEVVEARTYRAATRPWRLAVILAGVAANLLCAVLLFGTHSLVTGEEVDPVAFVRDGLTMTGEVTGATVTSLGGLAAGIGDYARAVAGGEVPEHRMMSPIGGAQLTGSILETDPATLLLLGGLFSASLAVLNLLPLLPLDGGHATMVVAESVMARLRNRPDLRLDPNRLAPVAVAVLVVLVALSASSAYLDVQHPVTLR